MCHFAGLIFTTHNLDQKEIEGKRILEVGALDVNGSVRPFLERLKPSEYIGVDLVLGKGVDQICRIEELEDKFGEESFDVVIATEVLEHVLDWRLAVSNLKRVCRKGGILLLSTRSWNFKYHGYPFDFWRYELNDFKEIFAELQVEKLESDPAAPGVFFKARKTPNFCEVLLNDYPLYSVLLRRRVKVIDEKKLYKIAHRKFQSIRIRKKLVGLFQKTLLLK